jgi:hypothetical protein
MKRDVFDPLCLWNRRRRPGQVACRLEAEILLRRHHLSLALRHAQPRVQLRGGDRAFMV